MGTNKKTWLCGIIGILSYGILDVYLWTLQLPIEIMRNIVFIQGVSVLFFIGTIYFIKKEVQNLLEKLSSLINQLISREQEVFFNPLKDELPSKLQVQITRFSEMLRKEKEDVVREKVAIESLLGDIAHQLKTPLTNVGMYTELLEDDSLDQETYSMFYEGLTGEVDKLKFLVDALIKMSKLEGGVIKLTPQEANIQDTCLQALKATHMKAKQKGIEIKCNIGSELILNHDVKWTSEAVGNLLDNAIKYSESGTSIKIEVIPYELFLRIDIEDEGIGISEEELPQIFKRFYRGTKVATEEGVGIGLYLARKIIADQGGYIKVKSKVGKGSVFSIFLTLKK